MLKVSTACSSFSLFPYAAVHVPLPQDRIPRSGLCCRRYLKDAHVYEPVTCPVCHLIHHVDPHTGVVLGEKAEFSLK